MNTTEKEQLYLMQTYKRFDLEIESGKGCYVTAANGQNYLDFTSGIGVLSLGHCHPKVVAAIKKQASKLIHTSNLFQTAPQAELAHLLLVKSGFKRAFFCNSGTEAVEAAIKLIRKYARDRHGTKRQKIVTLTGSFHGRSMGALSATGQPDMHKNFAPMLSGFEYVPPNNLEHLKKALLGGGVAGFMVEFVQGEGGVNVLERDYIAAAQKMCREEDIIFAADEVQTGIARTGEFLAATHFAARPDMVCLAKGLGGGLPIGALVVNRKLENVFGAGDHASTFGGNPLTCAVATEVVSTVSDTKFLKKVAENGKFMRSELESMKGVKAVTGLGLMLGIELSGSREARIIQRRCFKNGLLVLTAKEKIRLLQQITATQEELSAGLEILRNSLG